MYRITLLISATVFMLASSAYAKGQGDDPDMALLPVGQGREQVFYLCSACHSIRTVTQQKLSRRVWDETLDWMVEEQGMPEQDDEDRKIILDYLSEHVSPTQ